MNKEELTFRTILACFPLRQLGEDGMPKNFASAAVVRYNNKIVILSVFHATKDKTNWAVEVKSNFKTGTYLKELGLMGAAVESNINSENIDRVDFSYNTLPNDFKSYHQVIDDETGCIYEHERVILDSAFDNKPSKENQYSFFGQTEFRFQDKYVIPQSKLIMNMQYVAEEDQYYVFKLPFSHPGHEYFRGTSGAPVLDNNGNLVSLVCKGDKEKDLIFGLKLNKYKSLIDIQIDNVINNGM